MSIELYRKALKKGKKISQERLARGESPYLPALERILKYADIQTQELLGTIEIPMNRVIGTYASGRRPTLSHGFYPLMPEDSEFAQKWIHLCQSHLKEGLRDPITAFEFRGYYYIVEGHKRVSVLRSFDAISIRGTVTRKLPRLGSSEEDRQYAAYLHFYRLTGINYLWFRHASDYAALLRAVRKSSSHVWTDAERRLFREFYTSFYFVFHEKREYKNELTIEEAILVYLDIYDYESSAQKSISALRTEIARLQNEFYNRGKNTDIHLILSPSDYKSLFWWRPSSSLRIGFIYDKTAASSSWVFTHDLGRRDLEAAFGDQLETLCMDGADTEEKASHALETVIAKKPDLIFTVSPCLLNASVKAALAHPDIKILNCSLNTAHPSVRTYYARMYEAKFLMGVIAGCLTPDNKIGYIADYPIYGCTANINAFALGARMVNPEARIYLTWSKTISGSGREKLNSIGISYISDQDTISAGSSISRHVGLYRSDGTSLTNTALSVWRWGRLYERIVRNYLNGGWKNDAADSRPVSYWWGMDAGVIDLICSSSLPDGTGQLISILKNAVCSDVLSPFSTVIHTQDGRVLDYVNHPITAAEIITMDWLADNVVGELPTFRELLPEAQALVRIQGVKQI
ncbi:MAG: BMP family ABC transporter substrate-binding protein [Ruminococcus sp.]|jgi:basic membrane protein A